MRTKLVLWGTNANDERVLLALELLPEKNEVNLHVFTEEQATDAFTKQLMDEWRVDKEVAFPDPHQIIKRPLTMTDDLLPEEFKVERGDVIQRAQSEWAFVVLSYKLQKTFQSELDSFQERINQAQEFSKSLWEELKGFWEKVQAQVRERNLFREHVTDLREHSNELFYQMKKHRQAADNQFRRTSSEVAKEFSEKLEALQAKIDEGKHLINAFEDLKKLQREYHDLQLTRDDRNKLWARMDAAFKAVKEKRFGNKPAGGAGDAYTRVERRDHGLMSALDKMQKSIDRDEKDLHFETRRAHDSDGQLEMQIRQAKINMITERVNSKKEKMADMVRTREDLERRMASIKAKMAEEEEKKKVEEAKLAVKERIAREIEDTNKGLEEVADKLEAAAQEIAEQQHPVPAKTKKAKKEEAEVASDAPESSTSEEGAETPVAEPVDPPAPAEAAPVMEEPAVEETPVAEASPEETVAADTVETYPEDDVAVAVAPEEPSATEAGEEANAADETEETTASVVEAEKKD